nr:MAG TPA: hypothetical protein [Caudoviricetes sp.]
MLILLRWSLKQELYHFIFVHFCIRIYSVGV